MINMLRCSWIVAFCYCTLLVYFTVIVPLGLRSFTSLQWGSKAQHKQAPFRLPILRTVLLPVCVFVFLLSFSSFLSIWRSDSHGAKRREKERRRAERESRKEEQTKRGTNLIKVVSSISPSPTHQGLQYWHRAMQPVVGGSWRGGDRGRGSQRRLRRIRPFLDFGIMGRIRQRPAPPRAFFPESVLKI